MKSSPARNSAGSTKRPLLTGVLIGLVAGVGISAGVAVWVARMRSPFQNRVLETSPSPELSRPGARPAAPADTSAATSAGTSTPGATAAPAPDGAQPASAQTVVPGTQPSPQGAGSPAAGSSTAGAGASANHESGQNGVSPSSLTVSKALGTGGGSVTWLQVGAFGSEDDAQRQVESVAMLTGVRANVQSLQQSDKVLYRVRLGPYAQKTDYAELSDTLKSNGIAVTVIHTTGQ